MRLLLANGDAPGGADAILEIARRIWWGWPLFIFAKLPSIKPMLRALYRAIAANRYCASGSCKVRGELRWFDWLPLIVLPVAVVNLQNGMPPWIFMWALAGGIFIGCKWLTWRKALFSGVRSSFARSLAYFVAWPGMEAAKFLRETMTHTPRPSEARWMFPGAKTLAGVTLVLLAARHTFGWPPLAAGWLGMLGVILFLHFGLFELLALSWQRAGVAVTPVMIFRASHPAWQQSEVNVSIDDKRLVTTKFDWFKEAKLVGANFAPGFKQVSLGGVHSLRTLEGQARRQGHGASAFYEMP